MDVSEVSSEAGASVSSELSVSSVLPMVSESSEEELPVVSSVSDEEEVSSLLSELLSEESSVESVDSVEELSSEESPSVCSSVSDAEVEYVSVF